MASVQEGSEAMSLLYPVCHHWSWSSNQVVPSNSYCEFKVHPALTSSGNSEGSRLSVDAPALVPSTNTSGDSFGCAQPKHDPVSMPGGWNLDTLAIQASQIHFWHRGGFALEGHDDIGVRGVANALNPCHAQLPVRPSLAV